MTCLMYSQVIFWSTELYVLTCIQYIRSKACLVIHVFNLGGNAMTLKLLTSNNPRLQSQALTISSFTIAPSSCAWNEHRLSIIPHRWVFWPIGRSCDCLTPHRWVFWSIGWSCDVCLCNKVNACSWIVEDC